MIVDIHTHVFPDEIASRAIDSLIGDSHTRPFCDGTLAGLLKSRKQAGIDCCVVLPVATSPRQVLHMNDRAIQTNNLYRETGILSFGGMHPDTPDWKQELSRLALPESKVLSFILYFRGQIWMIRAICVLWSGRLSWGW